jgi:NlpC/P60 family protein
MFRELFHVELPRTTKQQIDLGVDVPIRPAALDKSFQVGDLIFYIDRAEVPSHVVCYAGSGMITHSVSGRGVVIEPVRALWGRRVVARRLFRGGGEEGGELSAIPAAGPIVPQEIPCPPSVVAKPLEVRAYRTKPVDIKTLGDREICDFRALADALRAHAKGSPIAIQNANALEEHSKWLESIEALKGKFGADRDE